MDHQRQGQGVDPRIAVSRSSRELGQFLVIALGKVLANLAENILDNMIVIGKPLGIEVAALSAGSIVADDSGVGLD
jgi:hypothetical protein